MNKKYLKSILFCIFFLIVTAAYTGNAEASVYGDFQYSVSGKNVTITKYLGNSTKVIIPGTIKGKKVKTIGKSAFNWCTTIKTVEVTGNVKTI